MIWANTEDVFLFVRTKFLLDQVYTPTMYTLSKYCAYWCKVFILYLKLIHQTLYQGVFSFIVCIYIVTDQTSGKVSQVWSIIVKEAFEARKQIYVCMSDSVKKFIIYYKWITGQNEIITEITHHVQCKMEVDHTKM